MLEEKLVSRTAIETYLSRCQRARYLGYEIGLSPVTQSQDLTLGTAVHSAVEQIFKGASYTDAFELVKDKVEEKELLKALIYAWYKLEYQYLKTNYWVIFVEFEIENLIATTDNKLIILQSRPDALLLNKATQELSVYSLKTIRQVGYFSNLLTNHDLQGYLETWAVEQWLEKIRLIEQKILQMKELPSSVRKMVVDLISRKIPSDFVEVDRIRFCFLVKGKKDKDGLRSNPLCTGWLKDGIMRQSYVKGADRCLISTDKIEEWVDSLPPETVASHVVCEEVLRNRNMLELTLKAVSAQEIEIEQKMSNPEPEALFSPNHSSCNLCEFFDYCYKPEVRENLDQYYQKRQNHHKRMGES